MIQLSICLALAASLFGASKAEQSLSAEIEGQAAQLAAQSQTIKSLQAQLAAAHVQTATANGNAAGSVAALKSRREADTKVQMRTGDSLLEASQLTAVLVQLSKEQAKRSVGHAETMDKIDRQSTMMMRLLALMAAGIVMAFGILVFLLTTRKS